MLIAVTLLAVGLLAAAPAGAKILRGTPDGDRLVGGAKPDRLSGKPGDDSLSGRRGSDFLKGGKDDDTLVGGKGFDDLRGAAGDDAIRARDGEPDIIDCGEGFDTVTVDAVEDGVFDCEEIIEP